MLAGAGGASPGLRLVRDEPERIVLAHEPPFRVGGAEFRPQTREVLFGGEVSIVEPRVMQVLIALHRAGGGVVSKDDLATLCWEGRIVGEDAINRVVSRLRSVAGKQAGGQFRVETITKVGYRLIEANGTAVERTGLDPRQRSPGLHALTRRQAVIGGSALGIAAAAGAGWTIFRGDLMPTEARSLLDGANRSIADCTPDQLSNAIGELRQATQIAPRNAEIWGVLAYAYMTLALVAPLPQRPALHERGSEAMRRALSLERGQPDALAANIVATRIFQNWYAVEQECRAALRIHPDHPRLLYALACKLLQTGRIGESLDALNNALDHMALSAPLAFWRSIMLWDLGRLEEADGAMAQAYALWPRQYAVWFTNIYYRMYNDKAAEAAAMVADIANRPIGIPDWNFDLVATQANALASGDSARIRDAVRASVESARLGSGFAENAAIYAGYAGDFDTAFRMFDALYFNRGLAIPDAYFSKEQGIYAGTERPTYHLFRRPLRALRRDPRFNRLTRELGLDDYWARTNSRALVIA
jgi:DNA-binding winged helix-turn-helix (wHTH) protein/Flp pilus assembly protein TadD